MDTFFTWLVIGIIVWFIYSAIQSYIWMKDEENPIVVYRDYTDVLFFVINAVLIVINLSTLSNGFEINNIIITLLNVAMSYTTFTNTYLMQNKDNYKTFVVWSGKFFLVLLFISYAMDMVGGAGRQRKYETNAEYASRDRSTRAVGAAGTAFIGGIIYLMIAERKFSSLGEYFKAANATDLMETAKKKALEAKEMAMKIKNERMNTQTKEAK